METSAIEGVRMNMVDVGRHNKVVTPVPLDPASIFHF